MSNNKYLLPVLSILILFVFIASASAADSNATDVLSVDESVNLENNLLSVDNSVKSNDTLKVSNDELLTAGNNWYVNSSKTSSGNGTSDSEAFKTLNEALNVAQEGNTIMIASGEYKGTDNTGLSIDKNLNFIKYGDGEAIFDAESRRRIWTVTATSININGLTFKNGNAEYGGAIRFENKLENSHINAFFINNGGAINGGAIHAKNGLSNVDITGIFKDNSANQGGAIYSYNNNYNVNINATFYHNKQAIYLSSGLSSKSIYSTISGSFYDNYATTNGGAIHIFADNVNINGTFNNNSATKYKGGAIYISGSNNEITGTFDNNYAGSGGAISIKGNHNNIYGKFNNNRAEDNYGGAVFISPKSQYNLIGGIFNNNSAGYGGAIAGKASNYDDFYAYNALFGEFNNNSANYGGAIYLSSNIEMYRKDMLFGNYIDGKFNINSAQNGGAVYLSGTTITNNTILGEYIKNSANTGGAINFGYCGNASDNTISASFISNKANYGGAIYSSYNALDDSYISNSIFLNNGYDSISAKQVMETLYFSKNWFGNTADDYWTSKVDRQMCENLDNWLFLDATVNPSEIPIGESSKVIFNLNNSYNDDTGSISHPDVSDLPDIQLDLVATNGNINKDSVLMGEEVIYTSTNGNVGEVTADCQNVLYSVNIYKSSTIHLDAPDVTKYYGGSERFVVTVKDKDNKPVAGAEVKIRLNGQTYTKTTDNNGETSIGINLNSGVYNVTTECMEIIVYSTVTVKDTVTAKDVTKIFRNGTQYQGIFVDSKGNLVKNTDIRININGVFYTRTTDSNGMAQMNINLPPGTYILTAINPPTGEQHTTKVTVLPNIVENYDLTKYYKNASQYSLRLLDDKGNPVGAGVSIQLNINGVFYTRTSDANGYVKMNINLPPGTYIVTAEYNGLRVSNTIKVLTVLEAKDLVMKYHDGSQFKAKVLDGQGKPYAGQNVTYNINGVFYTRTTGDDGIAGLTINLPAGEYIITSMYNGLNVANKVTIIG